MSNTVTPYYVKQSVATNNQLSVARTYVWLSLWTLTFGAAGINDFLVSLSGALYSPLVDSIIGYVYMGQAVMSMMMSFIAFA